MGADGRSRIKKKVRHERKTGHRRAFRVQGRCWWGRHPWHVKLREECTPPYSPEAKG
jgi:hypothetical protein